jgi:hypothetical protein
MFAGFNLKINESFFDSQAKTFQEYQRIGEIHLESQSHGVEKALNEYINNNIVDGSKIQKDLFPEIKTDIFLSHSSNDKKLVNATAGWINHTFKLSCFIDSNIWCYAGNIADKLNASFSNKRTTVDGDLYDYKNCLKVSEHVNTMLNIALQKMIDKCESVFLINTENSIHINNDARSIDTTYSPWIYTELVCSEIVRKKPLHLYRYDVKLYHSLYESVKFAATNKTLTISYNAPTQHLIKIDKYVLEKWKNQYHNNSNYPFPLDLLYNDYFKEEVTKVKQHFTY